MAILKLVGSVIVWQAKPKDKSNTIPQWVWIMQIFLLLIDLLLAVFLGVMAAFGIQINAFACPTGSGNSTSGNCTSISE